jgi:hypothetical protein
LEFCIGVWKKGEKQMGSIDSIFFGDMVQRASTGIVSTIEGLERSIWVSCKEKDINYGKKVKYGWGTTAPWGRRSYGKLCM